MHEMLHSRPTSNQRQGSHQTLSPADGSCSRGSCAHHSICSDGSPGGKGACRLLHSPCVPEAPHMFARCTCECSTQEDERHNTAACKWMGRLRMLGQRCDCGPPHVPQVGMHGWLAAWLHLRLLRTACYKCRQLTSHRLHHASTHVTLSLQARTAPPSTLLLLPGTAAAGPPTRLPPQARSPCSMVHLGCRNHDHQCTVQWKRRQPCAAPTTQQPKIKPKATNRGPECDG